MNCKTWTLIIALTLFAALVGPAQLAGQAPTKQPRYKLIDLGTLGGPHSYGSINGDGFQLLNNSGMVASYADTSVPDPNAPNLCFDPSCFIAHASPERSCFACAVGSSISPSRITEELVLLEACVWREIHGASGT
jgi:hypothetical protein